MQMMLLMLGLLLATVSVRAEDAGTAAPAAAPAEATATAESGTKVEKIAVGTAIENRELSGAATEFPATMTRLYCWTKVSGTKVPLEITHVWSLDGQKEAEVPLTLSAGSGRTWSSKSVRPGKWKVDVLAGSEGEIGSTEFVVK